MVLSSGGDGWPVYRSLDAWRGVAALWVVFFHANLAVLSLHPSAASSLLSYGFSRFGYLGVQMFFVISGYCIAHAAQLTVVRRSPVRRYLWSRVRRIYPTYWAALGLLIAASLLARGHAPSALATINPLRQTWRSAMMNMTLSSVAAQQAPWLYQSWTLCYELAFYFIVGAALWIALRLRSRLLMLDLAHALTVTSCGIWFALSWLRPRHELPYPLDLWPQFGLGILLFDLLNEKRRPFPIVAALLTLILMLAHIARYDVPSGYTHVSSRRSFALALAFSILLFLLKKRDAAISSAWPTRVFARIGLFSYSLYLIHYLLVGFTRHVIDQAGLSESPYPLQMAAMLTASLLAGWLLFQIAEKPLLSRRRSRIASSAQEPVGACPQRQPVIKT